MISISHSPNSDGRQQRIALSYLLLPWKWRSWRAGNAVDTLQEAFSTKHSHLPAFAFSTGREALYAVLEALEISKRDEVILQAYTCIVVPNAILRQGAKPIYIDIDKTLNLDPNLLEQSITKKTKAIIIQHTFGIPADINPIRAIADKHGIPLIEDCAHSLGATYHNQRIGTFGDAAIFSFGRDKIISSVSGGMAIVKDKILAQKIASIQKNSSSRKNLWIFQNLSHPLLIPWMSRLMGKVRLGQLLIAIAQKTRLVNKVYTTKEKMVDISKAPIFFMPNSMAALALQQLGRLDENITSRRMLAAKYHQMLDEHAIEYQSHYPGSKPAFLNCTILTDAPKKLQLVAKEQGYLLGNWYTDIIMPRPPSWDDVYYRPGQCPKAEFAVTRNTNLPTNRKVTKQVKSILDIVVKNYE